MRKSVIKLPEGYNTSSHEDMPKDVAIDKLLGDCEDATIKSIERGEDIDEDRYYQTFDEMIKFIEKKDISPTEMLNRLNGDTRTLKDRLNCNLYYFYDDSEAMKKRIIRWHGSKNRMVQEVVYAMLLKLKQNHCQIPTINLPKAVRDSLNNYHEKTTTGD